MHLDRLHAIESSRGDLIRRVTEQVRTDINEAHSWLATTTVLTFQEVVSQELSKYQCFMDGLKDGGHAQQLALGALEVLRLRWHI